MKRTLTRRTAVIACVGALLLPAAGGAAEKAAKKEQQPVYPAKAETMKIDGTLQFRFTHVDGEESDDDVNSFGWVRARLRFAGNLTERLYYQMRFQGDNLPVGARSATTRTRQVRNAADTGTTTVVDRVTDNRDEGAFGFSTTFLGYHLGAFGDIEVGRFDVEATPRSNSTRQAFAERPFHVEDNKAGGQLGVTYSNAWLGDRINLVTGVYNGGGDHSDTWIGAHEGFANDNKDMMYSGRLLVSPMANFPFDTESDLKRSPFGVGLVLGAWKDKRWRDGDPAREETHTAHGAALMVRGKGLFALADFTRRKIDPTGDNPATDEDTHKGWSTQLSYVIPVGKSFAVEPKARYERFEISSPAADDPEGDFAWTTVGVNLFIKGFDANFNIDYIHKKERGDVDSVKNNALLLQANMYF